MEKCGDEESMLRQFHSANLAPIPNTRNSHPRSLEPRYVLRIQAVIAKVAGFDDLASIDGTQARTGQQSDRMKIMQSRRIIRAARHGAVQRSHDAIRRTRVVFGSVRICDPQHIARMLYQSILETASSPGERHIVRASIFDAAQHTVRALIWAHRSCPQCVVIRQQLLRARLRDNRSRQPFGPQIFPKSRSRMLNGGIDRNMRVVLRIEIADDPDANQNVPPPIEVY
jgi:hypothetical protein